jgi:membrane peptidoglycan carboxypeptidase
VLLLFVVVVTGTAVLTAASAGTALMASLERGLPDVREFEHLQFAQPTKLYDRSGDHLLATFTSEKRQVVKFSQIPKLVLDATTAVEDRTFWENQGYDLQSTVFATLADVTNTADRGGASTITQQLVRARLLPKELLAPGSDLYIRKAKEIIQSAKLTAAFPGEQGKQKIITAYLNQIFYGHNAYGIAAAAKAYFGTTMTKLTLGQAALLAGLPQSPSILDPYRPMYSRTVKRKGKSVILVRTCQYGADLRPTDPSCFVTAPIARRDFILKALLDDKGRWTKVTRAQVQAAMNEPIVLAGDQPNIYKAPHFVVAAKLRLDQMLSDAEPVETGGYKVITTLNWNAQKLAEKYVMAGAVLPNLSVGRYYAAAKTLGIRAVDRGWINTLRGSSIHNAALTALDYRTGDVLAYVGSADYYDRYHQKSDKFDPKYDVAGIGYRQPGSAWKPMVYTSAFEERVVTPGTLLLDITTPFVGSWRPADADGLNRGPVLARYALQQSLNIPAIRTLGRLGNRALDQYTAKAGINYLGGRKRITQAGLAVAIGTLEVRVVDMVAAYGAFGNGGEVTEPRYILKIRDQAGKQIFTAGAPQTKKVWSPQAAWLMANILSGNSDPHQNPYWGKNFQILNGPGGQRRIMALKTGTTNGVKDVSTYGLLPQPTNKNAPALALGVWMGNSNHDSPHFRSLEVFATDSAGKIWRSFMRDYSNGMPVVDFKRPPKGLVLKTIDAFTGGKPVPATSRTKQEWFITGTEPGSKGAIDKAGLLYEKRCGIWVVNLVKGENPNAPDTWRAAVRGWMRHHPKTAGGPMAPPGDACYVPPSPKPTPTPDPNASPDPNAPEPNPGKTPKPAKPTPMPTKKPHKPNDQPAGDAQGNAAGDVTVAFATEPASEPGPVPALPGLPLQRQPLDVPGSTAARPVLMGRRRR